MKKTLALVLAVALVTFSCSAEDPAPPEEVGAVEQAAACPQDVICPGSPAYSYSAGTNIACVYYPGGIVYKPKPAACQQCCPKWGTCVPGGCGSYPVYTNIWTCRTGGSCSP